MKGKKTLKIAELTVYSNVVMNESWWRRAYLSRAKTRERMEKSMNINAKRQFVVLQEQDRTENPLT